MLEDLCALRTTTVDQGTVYYIYGSRLNQSSFLLSHQLLEKDSEEVSQPPSCHPHLFLLTLNNLLRNLHTLLRAHISVGISTGIILANTVHAICETVSKLQNTKTKEKLRKCQVQDSRDMTNFVYVLRQ